MQQEPSEGGQGRGGQGWLGWRSHGLGQPRARECVVWPPREQGRKCFRSGGQGVGCLV